jgi:hypothetical protein
MNDIAVNPGPALPAVCNLNKSSVESGMTNKTLVQTLLELSIWMFVAVVGAWGLAGMFATSLWIERGFGIDLHSIERISRNTWLSEYRFLAGREVGVALFALIFRREIVSSRSFGLAFWAIIVVSPLGRIYTLVMDGQPRALWNGFLAVELGFVGGFLVLWWLQHRSQGASQVGQQAGRARVP